MENNMKDFIELEYGKIADAHFNASQRVTTFFQYILAIYTAPLILLTDKVSINVAARGAIFVVIALIGFFICLYVSQLRFEAILYSRTVNGMRRYMYDNFRNKNIDMTQYSALFVQKDKPAFYDKSQFIWIVIILDIVNTCYLYLGLYFIKDLITNYDYRKYFYFIKVIYEFMFKIINYLIPNNTYMVCLFIFTIIFFLMHLISYSWSARMNEIGNEFYKHSIGIDIDGVLNEHRTRFCELYNDIHGTEIAADQITRLPVRNIIGLNISEQQEKEIFEKKEYWESMPVKEFAKEEIRRLKNTLGYDINIFTWRDWGKDGKFDIEKITIKWLKEKEICYDSLIIEKGNLSNPIGKNKSKYYNRFYISKKKKIEYFVEDNLYNAVKLSNICRFVFLIDHPYNQNDNLPYNVIRVNGWKEIYEKILSIG